MELRPFILVLMCLSVGCTPLEHTAQAEGPFDRVKRVIDVPLEPQPKGPRVLMILKRCNRPRGRLE